MSVAIYTSFAPQFDASGNPLSGGTVTVQLAGTTTLIDNFTASDLSGAPASNPITLDSAGRHDMRYIALQAYKIIVKNSSGTTIYTRDNIDPGISIGTGDLAIADGGTGASTAPAALTNLGGATAAELADIAAELASLSGTLASSEKTHIATGTTAQRPASPIDGDIRKNTTTARYEFVNAALAYENVVTTTTLKADVQALTGPFTKQYLTSGTAATYTTPADCTCIVVKMIGAGGGGGAAFVNAGANGGTTIFNSINANGGTGGATAAGAGGLGGTGGTGSASLRLSGSDGSPGVEAVDSDTGGQGAPGLFGMGAGRGGQSNAGGAAKANTGAGGGGGGVVNADAQGAGGGSGEYVEIVIAGPAATYVYTVGAGGNGGAAGGAAGGNGGSGIILVEEYYL